MSGYIDLLIRQALTDDPDAVIYDWFPFPDTIETVIQWSNGVIEQHWHFVRSK